MRTRGFTGLFILVPITALVVLGFIDYGQFKRIETAELKQKDIRSDLNNVQQLLAALENQPLIKKRVAVARTEEEQANFLDSLRIHAANADVKVELFVAQAPAIQPEGQVLADTIISRYQPMLSTVAVVGSFETTRDFAFEIMQSDRLLNMSSVKWERMSGTSDLRLTILLTRYVADFDTATQPDQVEVDAQANESGTLDEPPGDSNERP